MSDKMQAYLAVGVMLAMLFTICFYVGYEIGFAHGLEW